MTETAPPRLADRRRDLVARDIRRTALALFDDRGFDSVSVQDIAAAMGMSARTFFRYFARKDDILLDYQRHLNDRLCEALRVRPTDEGPVTALRSAFIATSTVTPDDHDAVVARARVLATAPALQARAQGERASGSQEIARLLAIRMDVDAAADQRPLVIAAAMLGAAAAAWDHWLERGGTGDPSRAIASALDLLSEGLRELVRVPPHLRGNV
jgi:AcrR family transcriptional regulator